MTTEEQVAKAVGDALQDLFGNHRISFNERGLAAIRGTISKTLDDLVERGILASDDEITQRIVDETLDQLLDDQPPERRKMFKDLRGDSV